MMVKRTIFREKILLETSDKVVGFISENERSHLELVSTEEFPVVEIIYKKEKGKDRKIEQINLSEFIAIKGISAQGNKLTNNKINEINLLKTKRLSVQEEKEEDTEEVIVEKQKVFLEKNEKKKESIETKKIVIDENSTDNQFKLEL